MRRILAGGALLPCLLGCAARKPMPGQDWLKKTRDEIGVAWVARGERVASQMDPTGCRFSWRDRRTVLEFRVDRTGRIGDVRVVSGSGAGYLDDLAVDVLRRVGTIRPPPPDDLFKAGADSVKLPFAMTLLARKDVRQCEM